MSASAPQATGDRNIKGLAGLQRFGRSLMLPIASLPAAALLLRLGQPDLLGEKGLGWNEVAAVIGGAGDALFSNLPLLFAIGVAIGMARRADGSTALAAAVGFVVTTSIFKVMTPMILNGGGGRQERSDHLQRADGIIVGLISAFLWQRYHRIKLPPYLAFFGGRRFVPMAVAAVMIRLACSSASLYRPFDSALDVDRHAHLRQHHHRRRPLRHGQPAADPARPAPHPEHLHVAGLRRVQREDR